MIKVRFGHQRVFPCLKFNNHIIASLVGKNLLLSTSMVCMTILVLINWCQVGFADSVFIILVHPRDTLNSAIMSSRENVK